MSTNDPSVPEEARPFRYDGGVRPGEKWHSRHEVSETYLGDPVEVPVMLINGSKPGPCLFCTAAIHGEEGSLRATATSVGIPTVTVEIRKPHRFQPVLVEKALDGVATVFAEYGLDGGAVSWLGWFRVLRRETRRRGSARTRADSSRCSGNRT